MNTTNEILMSAAGLEPGEQMRVLCPSCRGGNSGEHSLSLTVDESGGVLWHCFRAACGISGKRGGTRFVRTRHKPRREATRPFRGELTMLEDEHENTLQERIGWTEEHIAMARPRWAPEKERFAFPILGPMGDRRGYVLRSYTGEEPKALTRMDKAEPHLSWYRFRSKCPTTVVVEDIPSAVRAAKYVNAVALCGTGCGPDYANEIAAHTQDVVWALDEDATTLALKLHRRYGMLFHSSQVLPLSMDLKDMAEKDLAELLGELL